MASATTALASAEPTVRTLTYADSHPGLTLTYIPPAPKYASSSPPLFFIIHGGAFVIGDSLCIPPHLLSLAQKLGAGVASINYRLCPEVGVRQGIEDTREAWQFVFDKHGLGQEYSAKRTLLIGISAGGQYAFQLLLRTSPAQHPAAFLNIYGAVSVDVPRYRQPIPASALPHPLLDLPGLGFPPLNGIVRGLFVAPEAVTEEGSVAAWPLPFELKLNTNLAQPTGSILSFIDEHLTKGLLHPDECDDEWLNQHWIKRNGLSTSLYEALQAGRRMGPEDVARGLLMWWGFRTGTFLHMLRDEAGGEDTEAMLDNVDILRRLEADHNAARGATKGFYASTPLPALPARFPSTYTVHGTNDNLLPCWVSERFHELMKQRGEDSTLVLVQGEDHGFDSIRWAGGEGQEENKLEGWVRAKLGVEG